MKNKKHNGKPVHHEEHHEHEHREAHETQEENVPLVASESNPIMIPVAIVIAGIIIAGAIVWSSSRTSTPPPAPGSPAAQLKKGTIAEEIGLNKKKFAECLASRKYQPVVQAMVDAGVKNGVQGTPFTVIVAKNGAMLEINGAQSAEDVKKVIDLALSGKAETGISSNTGKLLTEDPVTAKDHILGNPNADVKIITHADLECPFCKRFHATMEDVMKQYQAEGKVAWVIRHFPLTQLHDKAPLEAEASECANELGGNAKFWEYVSLLEKITPANNGLDSSLL
ncbi:MAG: thioredoxin domain-containing protein [Candidatus Parcubacteria bacterium]|nr:thioredoxin domain-containing protein [Candidatus Parcubacteria bacterium]